MGTSRCFERLFKPTLNGHFRLSPCPYLIHATFFHLSRLTVTLEPAFVVQGQNHQLHLPPPSNWPTSVSSAALLRMPHKLKPVATAEQLCAAIHSLAAASSAGRVGPPVLPDLLASIGSITPSSIGWLCSSPELQPLVQRILALAEQSVQPAEVQPPPVAVDDQDLRSVATSANACAVYHSARLASRHHTDRTVISVRVRSEELSSLSSLCHTADLRLSSLQSSLSHLTAASHTLQQQLNHSQHTTQQHDTTLAHSFTQLTTLQQHYHHLTTTHTDTLHTLTASLAALPSPSLLPSLTEADEAVDAAVEQWEAAIVAEWEEWQSGELGVEEVEGELQRVSAALEVQYREHVHAEMQHLAAKQRHEAAVQQAECGAAVRYERDSEEHQSAARTHTRHFHSAPASDLVVSLNSPLIVAPLCCLSCSAVRWWMGAWSSHHYSAD